MAQINQQSTPSGSITNPASGSVALFSEPTDSGRLYLKDYQGNVYPAVSGSGGGSGLIPIQNDGVAAGNASTLNFSGSAVDSIAVAGGIATIGLSGGGGGGAGSSGTSGAAGTSGTSGAAGAIGTSGTSGAAGAIGTSGTAGGVGSSGTSGAAGAIGTSGTAGGVGSSGSSGAIGTSGTSGAAGAIGTSGTSGAAGAIGTSGTSGAAGAIGTSGTSGAAGAIGTSGTTGTSGAAGAIGTSGTSGAAGAIGTSGTSGAAGAIGTSGTSGAVGADGDRYQTTSSSTFTLNASGTLTVGTGLAYSVAQQILITLDASNYQVSEVTAYNSGTGVISFAFPTEIVGSGTASSWDVNLAGASGGDGSSGTSGAAGGTGATGTSGTTGTSGADGAVGTSGSSGADGAVGTSGTTGTSGADGAIGTSGTTGTSGAAGATGTSGTTGTSGANGAVGGAGSSGTSGAAGTSGTSGENGAVGATGTSGTTGTSGDDGAVGTSGTTGTSGAAGAIGTSGTAGADGTSGTSAAGGGGTPYTNVVRYEVASGSDKAQVMSSGNTISGLSWARTTTTLTITSTAHGLTTGDYVVLRNFNVDYVYAEITVSSVNIFTVQVANSGDTSGSTGVYIPAFDVSALSETALTILAPNAGNCQLLSLQVFINSSDTGTITVTLPSNALENGAGGNNTLDNRNPPQAFFYNVDGSQSSAINAGGVSFSMSGNHNVYTLAGGLSIFGSLMYTLHF